MQWKVVIAVVLLGAVFALGWYSGSLSGRLTASNRSADLALKQLDQVLDEQAQDRKRAEKLQKTLDRLPRSQGVIREVVRENPSGCELPAAVADKLREAIRKANASREMPADPVRAEQQRGQVDRERVGPAD